MVGRILRSADFERVLGARPRARSSHFVLHHVPARPSVPTARVKQPPQAELSTADAPSCPQAVDESTINTLPVQGWWLGTVVPKRHAKRAVTRNLLKRQMRTLMQEAAGHLTPGLWVLRLKAPFDPKQFPSAASAPLRASARAELIQLLERAGAAAVRAGPASSAADGQLASTSVLVPVPPMVPLALP